MEAEGEREKVLRSKIVSIYQSPKLNLQQKAQAVQLLQSLDLDTLSKWDLNDHVDKQRGLNNMLHHPNPVNNGGDHHHPLEDDDDDDKAKIEGANGHTALSNAGIYDENGMSLPPKDRIPHYQKPPKKRGKQGDASNENLVRTESWEQEGEEDGGIYGCKHYQSKSMMWAECCQKWINCRICHDESPDNKDQHVFNRYSVKFMVCMHCWEVQHANRYCQSVKCQKRQLAKYYCDICHLWESNPKKEIYHCDKCGICRIGKGLGIDNAHCDKCNACMSIDRLGNHVCVERTLESNCPICSDFMFTSRQSVIFMRCSHAIHQRCYGNHILHNYQCPVCLASVVDTAPIWEQIEEYMKHNKMPPELTKKTSVVFCNDCKVRSTVPYHFFYHKCNQCKGYNTTLISTSDN